MSLFSIYKNHKTQIRKIKIKHLINFRNQNNWSNKNEELGQKFNPVWVQDACSVPRSSQPLLNVDDMLLGFFSVTLKIDFWKPTKKMFSLNQRITMYYGYMQMIWRERDWRDFWSASYVLLWLPCLFLYIYDNKFV